MRRRHLLAGLGAALAAPAAIGAARAQQGLPVLDSLDDLARRLARHPAVPAAAVARLRRGEAGTFAVAGDRVVRTGPPVQRDDAWHLGSLTKAMTATLAARLVEAGAIGWDAVLTDHLALVPERWADVTLENLLTHTSGLPRNLPGPLTRRVRNRAHYARAALHLSVVSGKRGEFRYSNSGYTLAGAMLEDATGETWEALMRREVFAPLGMDGMGDGPPPAIHGHRRGPRAVAPGPGADNPQVIGPAGRLHAPPGAVLRFLRAHLDWDQDYLSADSWERLQLAQPGAYAMGWAIDGEGRLTHSGSNTLWWAMMEVDHAAGQAFFVAVNSGDATAVRKPVLQTVESLRTI